MKLQQELDFVVEQFKQITNLEEYAEWLKENGEYHNFENRLAWDCLHKTVGSKKICEWYDKYDCTDTHVGTLARKALHIVRGGN